MDGSAVLAKTPKGADEVKSRAHGLPQKLRSLLIVIDGNSTAGDLLARFGGLPEVETALDTLLAQGFIEARAGAAAAARPLPTTAQPARAETLSDLTRYLLDNLGPDADLVTGALEQARGLADFNAAAERCAEMLGALRGQAKAQAFRERTRAYARSYLGA